MRRILVIVFFAAAIATLLTVRSPLTNAAPPGREMAVVDIPDQTRLLKVTLQGKYIFVHDDQKMARGEPCFYVYEYSQDAVGQAEVRPDKLVVSFHCETIQREKATHLVLTTGMASATLFELREIQFSGSSEGHRVR